MTPKRWHQYEVYSDGGRLVARGNDLGRVREACRREMLTGHAWSCGVYRVLPDDVGLEKIYDEWRDERGRITTWVSWRTEQ